MVFRSNHRHTDRNGLLYNLDHSDIPPEMYWRLYCKCQQSCFREKRKDIRMVYIRLHRNHVYISHNGILEKKIKN